MELRQSLFIGNRMAVLVSEYNLIYFIYTTQIKLIDRK